MLVDVVLHGSLRKFHEGPIRVSAETAKEAIEAVTNQLPGFRPDPINGRKRITVVDHDTLDKLVAPLKTNVLHIFPQFNGGKQGGFLQILIGAALIGLAFVTGGTSLALGPLTFNIGNTLFGIGAMMVLGGIMQFLAPTPKTDKENKSRYLGSPKNTTAIGTRIPIIYGEDRVGGQYLSFDISAVDTGT